jgi:hypothetical protein
MPAWRNPTLAGRLGNLASMTAPARPRMRTRLSSTTLSDSQLHVFELNFELNRSAELEKAMTADLRARSEDRAVLVIPLKRLVRIDNFR